MKQGRHGISPSGGGMAWFQRGNCLRPETGMRVNVRHRLWDMEKRRSVKPAPPEGGTPNSDGSAPRWEFPLQWGLFKLSFLRNSGYTGPQTASHRPSQLSELYVKRRMIQASFRAIKSESPLLSADAPAFQTGNRRYRYDMIEFPSSTRDSGNGWNLRRVVQRSTFDVECSTFVFRRAIP